MGKKKAVAEYMNSLQEEALELNPGEGSSIRQLVQEILETRYVGVKYSDDLITGLEGSTRAILTGLKFSGEIDSFQDVIVSAKRGDNGPPVPTVSFKIQLPRTINYILISLELALNKVT